MNRILSALAVALLVTLMSPARAEYSTRYHLDATIVRNSGDPRPYLVFTLTVSKPITVYESDLPWGIRERTVLLGVPASTPAALSPLLYPDDPGPAEVRLLPGKRYQGKIELTRRIKGLSKALREESVIVFWSFQLYSKDGVMLNRTGGWCEIAANKP
jgi:hypothetical protein